MYHAWVLQYYVELRQSVFVNKATIYLLNYLLSYFKANTPTVGAWQAEAKW